VPRNEAADDAGDRKLRARKRNAQCVEKANPCLALNFARNRGEAQPVDERRDG